MGSLNCRSYYIISGLMPPPEPSSKSTSIVTHAETRESRDGRPVTPKFHQIGLPPYYEGNVQSKSTSSVRGVALSFLPFAAPPLGSVFGFRSRTASARFFSVGFGVFTSSGIVESEGIRFRFFRSKINGLKSPTVSVDTCSQLARSKRQLNHG